MRIRAVMLLALLALPARAAAFEVAADGLLRAGLAMDLGGGETVGGQVPDVFGFGRLRLQARAALAEGLSAEAALDLSGRLADGPVAGALAGDAGGAPTGDLAWKLAGGDRELLTARVDRLALTWGGAGARGTLGRQAIGFGTTRFFPVMDFIAPFAIGELDRDYRRGVDALRLELFGQGNTGFEFMLLPRQSGRGTTGIVTARVSEQGADLLGLVGALGDWRVVAGAVEAGIGGAGVRCEWAWWRAPRGSLATAVTVGVDGRLPGDINAVVEIYRITGAVATTVELARLGLTPFARGDWLVLSLGHQLHPLVAVDIGALLSLRDASATIWPSARLSLGDNLEAVAAVYLSVGPSESDLGRAPSRAVGYLSRYF